MKFYDECGGLVGRVTEAEAGCIAIALNDTTEVVINVTS